jgi:hypothetical protein
MPQKAKHVLLHTANLTKWHVANQAESSPTIGQGLDAIPDDETSQISEGDLQIMENDITWLSEAEESDSGTASSMELLELDEIEESDTMTFANQMSDLQVAWIKQQKEEDAIRSRPRVYSGNSERTKRHHKKRARETAEKNGSVLDQFFDRHSKKQRTEQHPVFINVTTLEILHPDQLTERYADELNEINQSIDNEQDGNEETPPVPPTPPVALQSHDNASPWSIPAIHPNSFEGEDPDDLKRAIWSDRQLISLVGQELERMEKKHHKSFNKVVSARITSMKTTINFYSHPLSTLTWRESSLMAATAANGGVSLARKTRQFIIAYAQGKCSYDALPHTCYGTFDTRFLNDEDLSLRIRQHLQTLGRHFTAQDVVDFIASDSIQALLGTRQKNISTRTAQRWLQQHHRYGLTKKGMYVDGHERGDVVEYRKEFLKRMEAYERRIVVFDVVDGRVMMTEPTLSEDECPLVIITHDESTFYENDRTTRRWVPMEETPVPQPKGEGASIMVSDFISPVFGRLKDALE